MKWFKLYGDDYLYGTTRDELTPEERTVWIDLLALASTGIDTGRVSLGNGIGYSLEQIAAITKVSKKIVDSALKKMVSFKKISIDKRGIISITNWRKYQSDWQRIKDMPSQSVGNLQENLQGGGGVGASISISKSIFNYYKEKIQPQAKNLPAHFKKIQVRLKTYSEKELRGAIDNFSGDEWRMENNASYGCSWFFNSDRRIEQFINLKPRGKPASGGGRDRVYKKK